MIAMLFTHTDQVLLYGAGAIGLFAGGMVAERWLEVHDHHVERPKPPTPPAVRVIEDVPTPLDWREEGWA
jgi:hypothetical protein